LCWLQGIAKSGDLGGLYGDMVGAALRNIEDRFANISPEALQQAAHAIWKSRQVFTLCVGVNNANARSFSYLAATGISQFHAIPRPGSTPADDLA
jgi:DNA-binding MurR/RpiR family transcriptional regulator